MLQFDGWMPAATKGLRLLVEEGIGILCEGSRKSRTSIFGYHGRASIHLPYGDYIILLLIFSLCLACLTRIEV